MEIFVNVYLLYFVPCILCYNDDFSDGYHYQRAFPQDTMVDVINNFGLALLEAHNEGNENNIALSPYGATSVLVALREGIHGYAIHEIEEAVRLPADVSVVRIGLRDVHRHLKSYFIPKEGFLAGLTFSNDKLELLPEYENILHFYGYDLDSFNNALYPDISDSTSKSAATNSTAFEMTTQELSMEKATVPNTLPTSTISETPITIITTESTVEARTEISSQNSTTQTNIALMSNIEKNNQESTTETETTDISKQTEPTTFKVETVSSQVTEGTTTTNNFVSTEPIGSTQERTTTDGNIITTQSVDASLSKHTDSTTFKSEIISTGKTESSDTTESTKLERTTRDENKITTQSVDTSLPKLTELTTSKSETDETKNTSPIDTSTDTTESTKLERTTSDENNVTTQSIETSSSKATDAATDKSEIILTGETESTSTTDSLVTIDTIGSTKLERTVRDDIVSTMKTIDTSTEVTLANINTLSSTLSSIDTMETEITTTNSKSTDDNVITNDVDISTTPFPRLSSTTKAFELPSTIAMENAITIIATTSNEENVNTTQNSITTTPDTDITPRLDENKNATNDNTAAESSNKNIIFPNPNEPSDLRTTIETTRNSKNDSDATEKIEDTTTNIIVTTVTTSVSTSISRTGENATNKVLSSLRKEEPVTSTLKLGSSTYSSNNDSSSKNGDNTEDYGDSEVNSGTSDYLSSTENLASNEVLDLTNSSGENSLGSIMENYYDSLESSTEIDGNNTEFGETSTNLSSNQKKRKTRSVIDYIIARYHDNFHVSSKKRRNYEPEENLSFLVYGRIKEPNINFMSYDAVLPFAYISILNALALSFPLDSSEYYLLLLLPIDENGIDRLICDLKSTISLREIINSLNYTHVKAIIPSFMLKGYVILTSTLQKLGIRKIFEPRHADFSTMTKEPEIYVTNIEQAVTVTIRNYVDPESLPSHRSLQQFRPVEFKADHPFLYFVMDTDIHVALMAGKIVNPLNSRIR